MKPKRDFWIKLLAEQRKWIEQCGGDLAGYIANYHGKHKRTVENATGIYNADMGELERIQQLLGEHPKPRTDQQTAAVIVFKPGVTKEQAQKLLKTLRFSLELQSASVNVYNPELGSPTFDVL